MKNTNSLKKYVLCVLFAFSLISCNRLMETDTPSNQISSGQVFQDTQSANAALAGLYGSLWNNSVISGGSDGTGALLGSYADDLKTYYPTNANGAIDVYNNMQTATNPSVERIWANAYQQIYYANSIIHGINNSSAIPVNEKERIHGEALFIRTLLYYYLVNIYGDIPYTESTDYYVNSQLTKTNSGIVINKLIEDIDLASQLLPQQYRSPERIYANKSAAKMLKGKLLMLKSDWGSAELIFKDILQQPAYVFQSDITKVFLKTSPGIIWQLKPKNNNDSTKEYSLYYFAGAAPNAYALTVDLVSEFSSNDLRKQNWILPVTFGANTFFRPVKYKNSTGNSTEYSVIFRLEEIYFDLAEALLNQNKAGEALPYINAIKLRAGLSSTPAGITTAQLMDEIQREKRKEFFAEHGLRFIDLKRWNKTDILLNTKPNWTGIKKVWPIPQRELLLNPNLNPQNNGY